MSYLVPASELSAGGFSSYGSGASNVARINTAPTSDTSNGMWADTFGSEDPCAYQLTTPAVGIHSGSTVKIGVIACGDFTEDSGTYAFDCPGQVWRRCCWRISPCLPWQGSIPNELATKNV